MTIEEGRDFAKGLGGVGREGRQELGVALRPTTCSIASVPAWRSLRFARTVSLSSRSRVLEVRIVGSSPVKSP
jgi:hypothetical protein